MQILTINRKKVFALMLALIFALTSLFVTSLPTHAAGGHFSGQGFEVEFIIGTVWSNGYTARIIITNTSGEPIRNWALRVDANLGVANWDWGITNGGRITAQDDSHTLITHHGWNSTLAVGSHTLYIANGTHDGQPPNPTQFVLTGNGFESGTNGAVPGPGPGPGEEEDDEEDEDDEDEIDEEDEDENGEDENDEDENGEDEDDEEDEDENGDDEDGDEDDDENGDEDDDENGYDENGDEDGDEDDDENGDEDGDEDDENGYDDENDEANDEDENGDDDDEEDIAPAALLAAAHDGPHVLIDGVPVVFDGQSPTIVGGRTLVPVRAVFEALGFDVGWHAPTRTVTLEREGYVVTLVIDSDVFYVNGVPHQLDIPAQIIRGSTMLPIRLVLESVGYDVGWDAGVQAVLITAGE